MVLKQTDLGLSPGSAPFKLSDWAVCLASLILSSLLCRIPYPYASIHFQIITVLASQGYYEDWVR